MFNRFQSIFREAMLRDNLMVWEEGPSGKLGTAREKLTEDCAPSVGCGRGS
jgi:hypothetical protein